MGPLEQSRERITNRILVARLMPYKLLLLPLFTSIHSLLATKFTPTTALVVFSLTTHSYLQVKIQGSHHSEIFMNLNPEKRLIEHFPVKDEKLRRF